MAGFGIAFKVAQVYATAQLLDIELDFSNVVAWTLRVSRVSKAIQGSADKIDQSALDEMVSLAQTRAPRRTGALSATISSRREDDVFVFEARVNKRRPNGRPGVDYAPFVEFGTKAGFRDRQSSRSDSAIASPGEFDSVYGGNSRRPGRFYRSGRRLRRVYHPHPGTEAQPFFFNSAFEVIRRRNVEQGDALARQITDESDT